MPVTKIFVIFDALQNLLLKAICEAVPVFISYRKETFTFNISNSWFL